MQAIAFPALATMGTVAAGGSATSLLGAMGLGLINAAGVRAAQDADAGDEAGELARLSLEASRLEADRVRAESSEQADELRKEQARNRAQHAAAQGASGLLLQGSPLQVLEGRAYLDEQDAQSLEQNGLTNAQAISRKGEINSAAYADRLKSLKKGRAGYPLSIAGSTINSINSNYHMF